MVRVQRLVNGHACIGTFCQIVMLMRVAKMRIAERNGWKGVDPEEIVQLRMAESSMNEPSGVGRKPHEFEGFVVRQTHNVLD